MDRNLIRKGKLLVQTNAESSLHYSVTVQENEIYGIYSNNRNKHLSHFRVVFWE